MPFTADGQITAHRCKSWEKGKAPGVSSALKLTQQRPARRSPRPPARRGPHLRWCAAPQHPAVPRSTAPSSPSLRGDAAEPRLTQPKFAPLCSAPLRATQTFFIFEGEAGPAPDISPASTAESRGGSNRLSRGSGYPSAAEYHPWGRAFAEGRPRIAAAQPPPAQTGDAHPEVRCAARRSAERWAGARAQE